MKLKKLAKSKHFFIQFQILKLYSQKKTSNSKITIRSTVVLLNKIANIIYQFHIADKKILFLGFPNNFSKTLKNTRHLFIPEYMWFHGMLSNKVSQNNYEKKTRIPENVFKLILKLKEKPSLILVSNFHNNSAAIKENYLARIPVITVSKKLDILNVKSAYESVGNYNFFIEKTKNTNFVFSFIKVVINQAKKKKNIKKSKNSTPIFNN